MNHKFLQKLEEFSGKMSQEIHLKAIRNSFMTLIPLLVLGGFMTFFAYVLFVPTSFMGKMMSEEMLNQLSGLTARINNGTMGIIGFLMMALVSYDIAKTRKFYNPMYVTVVTMAMYFIIIPFTSVVTVGGVTENVGGIINSGMFSTSNMFLALLVALVGSEVFMKLAKNEKLQIHIKGQVPPAIIESFNMIITVIITLVGTGIVCFILKIASGYELHEFINKVLQAPLVGFSATPVGIVVNIFLQNLCWVFGIHPAGVTNPIFDAPLLAALEQGEIINLPFRDVYGTLGGSGATIGLVIVILLFSKRSELRAIAKLGLPTSFFNINEPILFGIPIVYNLILGIPLCLVPVFNMLVAYFATVTGLVSKLSVYVAWSTPMGLSAYISSGGDLRNVFLQIALILADSCIYLFFVKIYEASLKRQEEKVKAVL